MRRTIVGVIVCTLLGASAVSAQPKAAVALPDKAMLDTVLQAWASMNPDNAAKYYDQSSELPFYDVAPLKYDTFGAYIAGVKGLFATLSSLQFTLNDDVKTKALGPSFAVSTATLRTRLENKSGPALNLDCRWTLVWQKKGANWMIIHEHISTPLPAEPPK